MYFFLTGYTTAAHVHGFMNFFFMAAMGRRQLIPPQHLDKWKSLMAQVLISTPSLVIMCISIISLSSMLIRIPSADATNWVKPVNLGPVHQQHD